MNAATVATDLVVMFLALYGAVSLWRDVRGYLRHRRALRRGDDPGRDTQ